MQTFLKGNPRATLNVKILNYLYNYMLYHVNFLHTLHTVVSYLPTYLGPTHNLQIFM
jgi:hypothetical protein